MHRMKRKPHQGTMPETSRCAPQKDGAARWNEAGETLEMTRLWGLCIYGRGVTSPVNDLDALRSEAGNPEELAEETRKEHKVGRTSEGGTTLKHAAWILAESRLNCDGCERTPPSRKTTPGSAADIFT